MAENNVPERRSARRVHFIQDVIVEGLGTRRCSDLSMGGMYLETPVSFPIDTIVDLQFKLPGKDESPVKAKTRVVYIHEGVGLGLVFVELSQNDRERIQKFVEQH